MDIDQFPIMDLEKIPTAGVVEKAGEPENAEERLAVTSEGRLVEEEIPTLSYDEVERMISRSEQVADRLEEEVIRYYGGGFVSGLRTRMSGWSESLLTKGEKAVDWVEAKGIPLPKSKLGMRCLSAGMGTVGAVIPGGAVLLALSVVLWRRDPASRNMPPSGLTPVSQSYAE